MSNYQNINIAWYYKGVPIGPATAYKLVRACWLYQGGDPDEFDNIWIKSQYKDRGEEQRDILLDYGLELDFSLTMDQHDAYMKEVHLMQDFQDYLFDTKAS